jgi:hypothetical protein
MLSLFAAGNYHMLKGGRKVECCYLGPQTGESQYGTHALLSPQQLLRRELLTPPPPHYDWGGGGMQHALLCCQGRLKPGNVGGGGG